ncbi:hypothetical protein K8O93_18670 [Gordonia bronchialis]|uniref:hypothetical protein n=1 Tax=Gordonia bronchialis TaxID=2054 RepID=UPI001CBD2C43|nr:hypothetical protein [Gordonia bronchialis]UAK37171.1 hypothetical protein K8O93_18670 [Gordonia bronchialis]
MNTDLDYAMPMDQLRDAVCRAYFAPDRVPALASRAPWAVMWDLIAAINDGARLENARIEAGLVRLSAPLRPLRQQGWFEILHAIRALHDVRVLVLPDGTKALGEYDASSAVFDRRDRWLHKLVSRYSANGSVNGVGNVRFHLEIDAAGGLLGRALRTEDVAVDLKGSS